MKKTFLYIFLAALFALASCVAREPEIPAEPRPAAELPKVHIEFQIAVPNDGPATKTMAEQPTLKNMVLVVFSDAGYFNEWVVAEKNGTVMAEANETVYPLKAKLSMSEGTRLRVHIIANCPSSLVESPPITGTSSLDTEQAVIARIQSHLGDTYQPDKTEPATFNIEDGYWQKIILPFGIEAEKEENGNTAEDTYKKDAFGNLIPTELTKNQFKMLSPIPLVRNFARVRLVNNVSGFTIEKFGLAYAPAQGVIAPILANPVTVDQWGARVQVTTVTSVVNGQTHEEDTAVLIKNDNTRVPSSDPNTVVMGLHLLGHEIKDPTTGADVLKENGTVSKYYDELFLTNYQNLPLQIFDTSPTYETDKTYRLVTEAPYNYGGYNVTPLTFAPNPQSDAELQTFSNDTYLYVYERPKPRYVSGKAEKATRIIIKGKFDGESSYKYYPVDILDKKGNVTALLRNHTYIVELNGIAADAGETDITKAPDASGSNVSDDPRTADINEVSDGTASIIVSYIDTTIIKSGTYSVMFRYIPNLASPAQSNADINLEIGYDGTDAGFQAGTTSQNGVTFVRTGDTNPKPDVSVEMDGTSPKLYVQNGNSWREASTAAEKAMGWSKVIYKTIAGDATTGVLPYSSSETIRVMGARGLHRDVRVNITPIKDMEVVCLNKYVDMKVGETEDLLIRLPKDLTRSMFPLNLTIEPMSPTLNPAAGENMPAEAGGSIVNDVTGYLGRSTFHFVRTLTRSEYEALPEENDMKELVCHFKTTTTSSATGIYVGNLYFATQSDDFYNYRRRYFNDLSFGSYAYGQEYIEFSFNFDQAAVNNNAYWDNETLPSQDYRVIPRQVTIQTTNLVPLMDDQGHFVDAGMTKPQNTTNYFIYNVSAKANSYADNLTTLRFQVLDETQDIGISLSTADLTTDVQNPSFIPNPDLYYPASATKSTSTFTKGNLTDIHFEDENGTRITRVINQSNIPVYLCFHYEGALVPVTFSLSRLTADDSRVTGSGPYTFTPVAGSGRDQRIRLKTSDATTNAAQVTGFNVVSTALELYNEVPSGDRNPYLSRFQNYNFTITPASVTLRPGETQQLVVQGADVAPAPTITWSSNSAAATVDQNGLVTAVSNGTVTITATAKVNGTTVGTATSSVTVSSIVTTTISTTNSTFNSTGNNKSFTKDGVTLTFSNLYAIDNNYVRPGRSSTITVTVTGKTIKRVIITFRNDYAYQYSNGTLSGTTWTSNALSSQNSYSISHPYDRSIRITSVTVEYE